MCTYIEFSTKIFVRVLIEINFGVKITEKLTNFHTMPAHDTTIVDSDDDAINKDRD